MDGGTRTDRAVEPNGDPEAPALPGCGPGGRGFESRRSPLTNSLHSGTIGATGRAHKTAPKLAGALNGKEPETATSFLSYIRRYRDWSSANRPKATNPSAAAVSKNLPNGCARIVCSAPSNPCAFCRSKVTVA